MTSHALESSQTRELLELRYALLRILLGSAAFVTLLSLRPLLTEHFSSQGWYVSRELALGAMGVFIPPLPPEVMHGLFWLCQACLVYFTLGFRTRWAGSLALSLMMVLYLRNPFPFDADDEVLRSSLFLLLFAPIGARWSVDATLGRRPVRVPGWPLALVRFKLVLLYAASGIEKLFGKTWLAGEAGAIALNNPAYARFEVPAALAPVLAVSSMMLPFVEIGLAVLLAVPKTRKVAVLLGLGFHVVLGLFMELRWLSEILAIHYIALMTDDQLLKLSTSARRLLPQRRLRLEHTTPE